LDSALVGRGLARSRAEARELICNGQVSVSGVPAVKPSRMVSADDSIDVSGSVCPYVSRAGIKLAAALDAFAIDPAGCAALDVGASTGGFTDCLLQRGAAHVVAVDVGHNQLHARLASDSRVALREGVNARQLKPSDFETAFDLVVADLSFISLTLVLPALAPLLRPSGRMVCLVKPQFEVGPDRIGKRGIVRDPAARHDSVAKVLRCAEGAGLAASGRITSPIRGAEGNEEFLVHLCLAKRDTET
jgi:23S rRNA (cytidine1920-2'-O)/16S rRNA (cytidine1409-2'-O)-methyltransferase